MRECLPSVDNISQLPALYLRPSLRAEVHSRNPRRFLAAYTDCAVTKECDLDFRITNEDAIPWDATVTWVVRNQGDEAARVNDLGHTQSGVRQLSKHEITRYAGPHYMDCIVARNGQFLGMASIKVNILDRAQQRPSSRPLYRRFR